ncbi:MAG: TonB-dependent receptor domain-containing protein [Pseudomonas sp.]|uniref:TonB-dependent receptor domain-containing protein n=1 Tax=Pseudomonas sp. TaxID=306 RepID=UPI003D0CBCC0
MNTVKFEMQIPTRTFALAPLAYALLLSLAAVPEIAAADDATQANQQREYFAIEAGPLADTLLAISHQTRTPISFDQASLEGLNSTAIQGDLSRDQAIDRALRNTGLQANYTASGAIVISQGGAKPAAAQPLKSSKAHGSSPSAQTDTTLATVVTLGTRRQDVTALKSLAPVELITPEQIEHTGAVTLNQALSQLVPSFNFPQGQNASKGTSAVRSASLRGLSPAYTLILVNGKRRNPTGRLSGVDPWGADQLVELNNIPISAIERVEVLRDGASAQYGSDAIAGVLNIVLKERDSGAGLQTRYGQYKEGDGETRNASGWWGTSLPGDGFLTLSADGLSNNPVDRSGVDHQYVNAGPAGDLRSGRWGQGGREQGSLLANAELGLNDQARLYSTLNYGYSNNFNDVNPNYASSRDNIKAFYPNGFQPRVSEKRYDLSSVVGLKYTDDLLGNFDLSLSYGKNEVKGYLENSLSPSYGLASATHFYRGASESKTTNLALDWDHDLDFSWAPSPWTLSGGAAYRHENFAINEIGDEQSWDYGGGLIPAGQLGAGQRARFGAVDIAGINPDDLGSLSRNVYGLYAGLEGHLTEKLELGTALRAENYSDFGNTVNGKLSARYTFNPAFAVRSTFSTGYRAPSLGQLSTQTTTYTGNWSFDGGAAAPGRTRLFRPGDGAVAAFGAKELDAVKAKNLSLGFVWTPTERTSLTVDAYQINIEGNILATSTLQDPANNSSTAVRDILAQANLSAFTGASFYTNGYDTKTRGVDAQLKHRLDLDAFGKLDLGAGFSVTDTKVSNVKQGSVPTRTGTTLFTRDVLLNPENGTPENKLILSGDYTVGKWGVNVQATRFGEYTYNHPTLASQDQTFSAQWVVDLDVRYQLTRELGLNVGANNLFDTYPEKYKSFNQVNGINRYGFIAPAGASGGFYYVGLNYQF